jgi:hypothetical protein
MGNGIPALRVVKIKRMLIDVVNGKIGVLYLFSAIDS